MDVRAQPSLVQYVGGLFLTLAALAAGNLLGLILTSIWGWENLSFDRPAGVALGAVQGAIGAILAGWANEHFLEIRVACFWLKLTVWIAAALIFVLIALGIYVGHIEDIVSWSTAAAIVYFVAIELVRRQIEVDLR